MPHYINDECINCGTCETHCPAGAIAETGGKCVVDPLKCTDCGYCEKVCPIKVIKPLLNCEKKHT